MEFGNGTIALAGLLNPVNSGSNSSQHSSLSTAKDKYKISSSKQCNLLFLPELWKAR
ncbi:MAG: hypothetical protein ABRQ27_05360 [Clostridiaceae bacterium]